MAGGLKIETPKGAVFTTTGKNGKITARLEWNKNFSPERSGRFNQTQRFVDSEVLRLSSPYVPFQTGMLDKSGILGTDVGSGEVNYIAPYASRLYYGINFHFDTGAHPNAGAKWFERMKIDHKGEILRGAKKISGGK